MPFSKLTETMWVAPQLSVADVARAADMGVKSIINNRPDGEGDDQPAGADLAAAAHASGLNYAAIPVSHAGFSAPQVEAMRAVLDKEAGPILAFCRSGTRSCFLWALAEAHGGKDVAMLREQAAAAGYDLSPIAAMLDMLAAGRS